jgi:hypothetical protein
VGQVYVVRGTTDPVQLLLAMGLFLLQDGINAKFDSHRARFYWEGVGPKRKLHLMNYPTVCRPKDCGGMGIVNSRLMNVALMLKWVWKLYQDGNLSMLSTLTWLISLRLRG